MAASVGVYSLSATFQMYFSAAFAFPSYSRTSARPNWFRPAFRIVDTVFRESAVCSGKSTPSLPTARPMAFDTTMPPFRRALLALLLFVPSSRNVGM